MSDKQLRALEQYNACDISDALVSLKLSRDGFIPNLRLQNYAAMPHVSTRTTFAPITTVQFAPKGFTSLGRIYQGNKLDVMNPSNAHYVDTTPSSAGHIVLMSAPPEATCAVLGGIMALRMSINGASAIVVDGRVRDLAELQKLSIPVWSTGTSTVGAGAQTMFWARNKPVEVQGVKVEPGDILCADPVEQGVVVIPKELIEEVLVRCARLTQADERVVEDVRKGMTVQEAFAKHRSNL